MANLLNTMSLARGAGRLVFGFDTVKEALLKGQSCLVILASDLSDRTVNNVAALCSDCGVKVLHAAFTTVEAAFYFKKNVGVFSINDAGFADKIWNTWQNKQ